MAQSKSTDSDDRVVTSGSNIRLAEPSGRRKPKPKKAAVASKVVTKPVSGFTSFLSENAVVGLAVGFVIATQVQALVKQLISSFIDPLVGVLIGGAGSLSAKTAAFHHNGKIATFGWGAFAYAFLDFLAVLATIYVIIKIFKLDKFAQKKKS